MLTGDSDVHVYAQPCVYIRWSLYKLKKTDSTAYVVNGVAMLLAFFLARNVFGLGVLCYVTFLESVHHYIDIDVDTGTHSNATRYVSQGCRSTSFGCLERSSRTQGLAASRRR